MVPGTTIHRMFTIMTAIRTITGTRIPTLTGGIVTTITGAPTITIPHTIMDILPIIRGNTGPDIRITTANTVRRITLVTIKGQRSKLNSILILTATGEKQKSVAETIGQRPGIKPARAKPFAVSRPPRAAKVWDSATANIDRVYTGPGTIIFMWAKMEMCIGMMKTAGLNAKAKIGTRSVGIKEHPQQTWPAVATP